MTTPANRKVESNPRTSTSVKLSKSDKDDDDDEDDDTKKSTNDSGRSSRNKDDDDDDDKKSGKSGKDDDDDDDDKEKKKKKSSRKKSSRRRGRRSVKCSGRNSNGLCTRSKYKYTDLCKEIQDDCEYDDDLSSAEEDLCKELGFCVYDSATIAVI